MLINMASFPEKRNSTLYITAVLVKARSRLYEGNDPWILSIGTQIDESWLLVTKTLANFISRFLSANGDEHAEGYLARAAPNNVAHPADDGDNKSRASSFREIFRLSHFVVEGFL